MKKKPCSMVFALTHFYVQILFKSYFLNSIHYSYSLFELFIQNYYTFFITSPLAGLILYWLCASINKYNRQPFGYQDICKHISSALAELLHSRPHEQVSLASNQNSPIRTCTIQFHLIQHLTIL